MKVEIELIDMGKESAMISCFHLTKDIKNAVDLLEKNTRQLIGKWENETVILSLEEILYFESVDERVFAYTLKKEYRMENTLMELEELLKGSGFFRCSKAFIINIYQIRSLTSELGSRIDATLKNGEHILISRHYAKMFKELLKERRL